VRTEGTSAHPLSTAHPRRSTATAGSERQTAAAPEAPSGGDTASEAAGTPSVAERLRMEGRSIPQLQGMSEAQLVATRVSAQIRRRPDAAVRAQGAGIEKGRVPELLGSLWA
jgi:hypothetical protein